MASIICFDDFSGQLSLPDDQEVRDTLNGFIQQYEPRYLKMLLGEHLYLLMHDEMQQDPMAERWVKLIEGERYEVEGRLRLHSGLRRMLAGFVFVSFVREYDKKMSAMGIVVEDSETAKQATRQEQGSILQSRYNESVELYESAQEYIEAMNDADPAMYAGYETVVLEKRYWGGFL